MRKGEKGRSKRLEGRYELGPCRGNRESRQERAVQERAVAGGQAQRLGA